MYHLCCNLKKDRFSVQIIFTTHKQSCTTIKNNNYHKIKTLFLLNFKIYKMMLLYKVYEKHNRRAAVINVLVKDGSNQQ